MEELAAHFSKYVIGRNVVEQGHRGQQFLGIGCPHHKDIRVCILGEVKYDLGYFTQSGTKYGMGKIFSRLISITNAILDVVWAFCPA